MPPLTIPQEWCYIIRTANILAHTPTKSTHAMTTTAELAQLLLETMPILGQAIGRSIRTKSCTQNPSEGNLIIHITMLRMLINGPKTFQELLAFRGVAAATLSRSIDAMVKHAWVERVQHPDDKRQVLLHATDEGRRYFFELVDSARTNLIESLRTLNADERATIAEALTLLRRTLPQ